VRSKLRAVWGSSASDVYAAGYDGVLMHFDGSAWSNIELGTMTEMRFAWGESSSNVLVGGQGVYQFDGKSWGRMDTLGKNVWRASGLSSCEVYAGTGGKGVLGFDGARWHDLQPPPPKAVGTVWASCSRDVYASGNDVANMESGPDGGFVLHYDGIQWSEVVAKAPAGIHSLWGLAWNDVYAAGGGNSYGSLILHFDGSKWSEMPTGFLPCFVETMWGRSSNDLYAAGAPKLLHYDGTSWSQLPYEPKRNVWGSWGLDDGSVYFAAEDAVLRLNNGNVSRLFEWRDGDYEAIWGTSESDLFAVGHGGQIAHFDGSRWSEMSSNTDKYLFDVWGASSSNLYAVGEGGVIHYDGSTWSAVPSVPLVDASTVLRAVWGSSEKDVWAVGRGLMVHFDGAAWTGTALADSELMDVWGASTSDVYAVGQRPVGGGKTEALALHFDGNAWTAVSGFGSTLGLSARATIKEVIVPLG
jgi:hypothetical protein